jgi:aminoglycoside phosphotransferase (APT) family kinase protein
VHVNKADITSAVVECLVREQFPQWSELPVRPVDLDGWDNTTFRLGDDLSARLPSADGYVPQIDKEHRWLPLLAPQLPLPVPQPIVRGLPGCGFPRPWSVYRWLPGRPATAGPVDGRTAFASDLADFLRALRAADASEGPPAGGHSFHRGGPLATYDSETRATINDLADEIDVGAATAVWDLAVSTHWEYPPVWVHGDVTPSNLLVVDGRLSAVIDFGCCAVGDPACDTAMAWTVFSGESRHAFVSGMDLDEATWHRGRGWALWKALITRRDRRRAGPGAADPAARFGWRLDAGDTIAEILTVSPVGYVA